MYIFFSVFTAQFKLYHLNINGCEFDTMSNESCPMVLSTSIGSSNDKKSWANHVEEEEERMSSNELILVCEIVTYHVLR